MHFPYGIRQENRLAAALRRRSYETSYAHGSRGPYDISADKSRRYLDIQVKAVRASTARIGNDDHALEYLIGRMAAGEETRLLRSVNARGRHAAVSLINGNYFWLWRLTAQKYALLHDGWLPDQPLIRE